MIVLDASVVVELLTNGPLAEALRRDLAERDEPFIVPHLLDIEVVSALRKLAAGRHIDSHRCDQLLTGLASLPVDRYPHTPLLSRMWELRHNFTAYDAEERNLGAGLAGGEISGGWLEVGAGGHSREEAEKDAYVGRVVQFRAVVNAANGEVENGLAVYDL